MRTAILLPACIALAVSSGAEPPNYAGWDKFYYKFQLPIKAAAPSTRVTMSVYHSYPSPLHNVRVACDSRAVEFTTRPAVIRTLDPTLIESVVLNVRVKDTGPGRSTMELPLRLAADELPSSKPVTLRVPLTASAEMEVAESIAVPVGGMEVTVGGLGRAAIYVYAALITILLVWFVRRRMRSG